MAKYWFLGNICFRYFGKVKRGMKQQGKRFIFSLSWCKCTDIDKTLILRCAEEHGNAWRCNERKFENKSKLQLTNENRTERWTLLLFAHENIFPVFTFSFICLHRETQAKMLIHSNCRPQKSHSQKNIFLESSLVTIWKHPAVCRVKKGERHIGLWV